jgi:hypothetical protein
MEIHHHPKHADKPRKLKEYLFEFFVIFIAITGSFFAENLRENLVDKHRVKEHMVSIVRVLKTDSALQKHIVSMNEFQVKGLDSLLLLMEDPLFENKMELFYRLNLKYALEYNIFNSYNSGISQLKNAGDFRLIKKREISEGIANYENTTNVVIYQSQLLEKQFARIGEQQTQIIDFLELKKLRKNLVVTNQKQYPALLTNNVVTIHSYYFNLAILRGVINSYISKLNELNSQSSSLIEIIQKEYNTE